MPLGVIPPSTGPETQGYLKSSTSESQGQLEADHHTAHPNEVKHSRAAQGQDLLVLRACFASPDSIHKNSGICTNTRAN